MPMSPSREYLYAGGSVPHLANRPDATAVPLIGSRTPSVGVYASFADTASVKRALDLGWPGVAATGGLGTRERPYTGVLPGHPDRQIASVLDETGGNTWWLSFWTVSWPATGDTFHAGGYVAGQYVAGQFSHLPGSRVPNYVILDPEGYNTPASSTEAWQAWVQGWCEGLKSVHPTLQPALYCNQSQYMRYGLQQLELPVFVAVSPIKGNTPFVQGGNVAGYCAYYAGCPAADDIRRVQSWGGRLNTVQFRDSRVDCGPR